MNYLLSNPKSSDSSISILNKKLEEFYINTKSYTAFTENTNQYKWYEIFECYLKELIIRKKKIRVLEIGAGKSNFGDFIKPYKDAINYVAQDITNQNYDYLKENADEVIIGDIAILNGKFDIIFSTFVFEHIVAPEEFLFTINRLLNTGGVHIIISPRYDFPGYLCPSLRHYNLIKKVYLIVWLLGVRLITLIKKQSRFLVNCNPAVFNMPWFRDSDAVHIVSRIDVENWYEKKGYSIKRLNVPFNGFKNFFFATHMVLAVSFIKVR